MNGKSNIISLFKNEGFSQPGFLKDSSGEGTVIIAAFPLRRPKESLEKGIKIAPFAASNHYKEAIKRLKRISLILRESTGLTKKEIRLFSNSNLEEKKFAALSGIGFIGRNSLIITREWGSRIVLAGMVVPLKIEIDSPLENGTISGGLCGSCRNCMKACPTGAIEKSGKINRDKCLQSLATDDRRLPVEIMEKWGNRLYGCTICQDCCPYNRSVRPLETDDITGSLEEQMPLQTILNSSNEELKEKLKGTALGLSWITAENLKRNAILSAASCCDRKEAENKISLIQPYLEHPSIAYAAQWTIGKLREITE